jgi:hypothetical protein
MGMTRLSLVAASQLCGQGVGGVHLHSRTVDATFQFIGWKKYDDTGAHLEEQNTTLTAAGYFERHFLVKKGKSSPCTFAVREIKPEWSWP